MRGEETWPLFLRAHDWLRLLDATVENPFFSAAERTEAANAASGWHAGFECWLAVGTRCAVWTGGRLGLFKI